jgi:N-acetylneuraminate lyase
VTGHDISKFSGVMPALFTPYDQDGNLDTDRALPLLDRPLERGVNGFYVGGSTGEWPQRMGFSTG